MSRLTPTPSTPLVLSIAGVDPSGGAGILADVKAISALGAYGMAVVAALTAQNTRGVTGIHALPASFIAQQIDTVFDDIRVDAVKIGMLGQQAIIHTVADRMAHWKPAHLVLDPVMVAKGGDHLLEKEAVDALRESLLPMATMLTPNLPEAGVLLDARPVETLKEMRRAAEQLRRLLDDDEGRWIFLKGGHLPGNETIDILHDGDRLFELPGTRIPTRNTHGTGCTLSAALAALLPRMPDAVDAAKAAKAYLVEAIRQADTLGVGSGHGPVHHFHHWWPTAT